MSRPLLRSLLPLALLMVSSCNYFGKGACEKVALEVCDSCDLDDYTKDVMCGCIEDGEVKNADDYFRNDDDAEMYCARLKNSLKPTYLTNEDAATCRSELDFLKEFGKDACEYLGFEDGYDYYDYYDYYGYSYDSGR